MKKTSLQRIRDAGFINADPRFDELKKKYVPVTTPPVSTNGHGPHYVLFGSGPTPPGFRDYQRGFDFYKLVELTGEIHIRLQGAWWAQIRPERLQVALAHLEKQEPKPIVTVVS